MRIHLEPGTEEKFPAEAAKAAKETAGEPGCEMYAFFKDLEETAAVILFEKWKNVCGPEGSHGAALHGGALEAA